MSSFAIVRYLPNGELDSAFGDEGKVVLSFANRPVLDLAVRVGSNDSITVCGGLVGSMVGIARVHANGSLVSHLGNEAKFISPFMEGETVPIVRNVMITQVRPVIGPVGPAQPGSSVAETAAVEQHLSNSTLGSFLVPRVVAVGDVGDFSTQRFAAIARYGTDAQPDQSFSNDGEVLVGFQTNTIQVRAAAFNPNQNRIVLIADGDDNNLPLLRAARFLSDGRLDTGFGTNGKVNVSFLGSGGAWTIQPRDAVIQAGKTIITGSAILPSANVLGEFAVARLQADGASDSSFGDGGVGLADFGAHFGLGSSKANSVRIDPRTRIIAAGSGGIHFAIARFLPNGQLDSQLDQQGMVSTPFSEGESEAFVVKIDSPVQERIVAAGEAGSQFALARYREDGSLDSAFGIGGKVRTTVLGQDFPSRILDIDFDSQQRIIAVGIADTSPPID